MVVLWGVVWRVQFNGGFSFVKVGGIYTNNYRTDTWWLFILFIFFNANLSVKNCFDGSEK